MRYLAFHSPRKTDDMPLKTYNHEPVTAQIMALALKHGNLEVVSEEDYIRELPDCSVCTGQSVSENTHYAMTKQHYSEFIEKKDD